MWIGKTLFYEDKRKERGESSLYDEIDLDTYNLDLDIVEKILAAKPDIVGFGVYIWNIVETTNVVSLLKVIAPEIKVVLGGPEVSYESEHQDIVNIYAYG